MAQNRNKIPFAGVMAEIEAQFPNSDLDADMLLTYAKTALALLEYDADTVKDTYIDIERFGGKLPPDYYDFEDAYSIVNGHVTPVRLGTDSELRRRRMSCDPLIPHLSNGHNTVVVKPRLNSVRTTFKCGKLFLIYSALTTDDQGNILLPSEENAIQAVKAFCIMESFRESFYQQKTSGAAFQEMKQSWEEYRWLAQQAQFGLSEYDYRMLAAETEARYRNFDFDKPRMK